MEGGGDPPLNQAVVSSPLSLPTVSGVLQGALAVRPSPTRGARHSVGGDRLRRGGPSLTLRPFLTDKGIPPSIHILIINMLI